jgi:ectoine hydroxylase-related dioxygenase (phytanoyl-CoA dioxygenase family)
MIRREAHLAIKRIMVPALDCVLEDYRVVLCSFVVRAAGSALHDMPLHQDWSFVDESRARSIGLWAPLVDVGPENGCLAVVKGSHIGRHPPRAIGGGFLYPEIASLVCERYLKPLPVKTGEAVIFDHRLFHSSTANSSAADRVAVGVVLLPKDVPLRVCTRTGDGRFVEQDVDDDYFIDEQREGRSAGS